MLLYVTIVFTGSRKTDNACLGVLVSLKRKKGIPLEDDRRSNKQMVWEKHERKGKITLENEDLQ